jgi:hypothetical protein
VPGSEVKLVVSACAAAVLGAVVGAVVGAVGSVVHQLAVGGERWPVGLAVALVLTALWGGVLGRVPVSLVTRLAGVLGWAAAVLLLSQRRSEGDLLVPANARGYTWMLAGFVLLVALAVLPARAAPAGRR